MLRLIFSKAVSYYREPFRIVSVLPSPYMVPLPLTLYILFLVVIGAVVVDVDVICNSTKREGTA